METAHYRTGCVDWPRNGVSALSRSAMPTGRMSTLRKRWRTPNTCSTHIEVWRRENWCMRKAGSKAIVLVAGIALLAWLIYRAGPRNIVENLTHLGWGSALVIALGGITLVVRT